MNNEWKDVIEDTTKEDYADGVLINPEDKDYANGNLMRVCLWCGAGYNLDVFYVYTNDAEYALNKTVAYCEKQGYDGLIFPVEETIEEEANYCKEEFEAFKKENPEEDRDMFYFLTEYLGIYVYVDATREGASKPYFVYKENLRIENVEEPMNESEIQQSKTYVNKNDLTDEEIIQATIYVLKQNNNFATVFGWNRFVENAVWNYLKKKKGWTRFPSNLYNRISNVIYENKKY